MKFHLPFPRHTETRYVTLNTSRCRACWACVQTCSQHVIGKVNFRFHRHAHIDQADQCKGCLRCVKTCKSQAILTMEKTYDSVSR